MEMCGAYVMSQPFLLCANIVLAKSDLMATNCAQLWFRKAVVFMIL